MRNKWGILFAEDRFEKSSRAFEQWTLVKRPKSRIGDKLAPNATTRVTHEDTCTYYYCYYYYYHHRERRRLERGETNRRMDVELAFKTTD